MAWAVIYSNYPKNRVILTAGNNSTYGVSRCWATRVNGIVTKLNINPVEDGPIGGALCARYAVDDSIGNLSVSCHFKFFAKGLTAAEANVAKPNYDYPFSRNYYISGNRICASKDGPINENKTNALYWPSHGLDQNPFTLVESVYSSSLNYNEDIDGEVPGSVLYVSIDVFSGTNVPLFRVDKNTYNSANPNHYGGEVCRFIATPNEHFRVKEWKLNSSRVYGQGVNTADITLPYSSAQILCEFEQYMFPNTTKTNIEESIGFISKVINSEYYEADELIGSFKAEVTEEAKADYKFKGWYKCYIDNATPEQCNTLVSAEAEITITAEGQPTTYCAKFVSKQTTLRILAEGEGSFDFSVNGETQSGLTEYINEDAREGWDLTITAKPTDNYSYFSHWLTPLGETTTQSIYNPLYSMTLQAREENKFIAYFYTKNKKPLYADVDGVGKLVYDYFDKSAEVVQSGENLELFEASEITFTAIDTSKLHAFDHFEYRVNNTWFKFTDGLPVWVTKVEGASVIVNIPASLENNSRGLRAVFLKKTTYTIKPPTIAGEHPINGTLPTVEEGCSVSGIPDPDEVVDGVNRWLEGTKFTLTVSSGSKWDVASILVAFSKNDKLEATNGKSTLEVTLNDDIVDIQVGFNAKTYPVSTSVDQDSSSVGSVRFSYSDKDEKGNIITLQATTANVYVDTAITLNAVSTKDKAEFYDWKWNDVSVDFVANEVVTITRESSFVARFAVEYKFIRSGSITLNDTTFPLGEMSATFNKDGYATTVTLPTEKGEDEVAESLVCGSVLSLAATPKSGEGYVGYFNGWKEVAADSTEIGITGWGTTVEEVKVLTPRTLLAVFSSENRWPILRLREIGNVRYASFSVAGVKAERAQKLENGNIIELENRNDYFCDPFSIVQVRLDKINPNDRFLRWKQYEFGTIENPGTEEIGEFANTQDISVFMTGNTYLVPTFYTDTPIKATAGVTDGVKPTWGDVSIEGEPIKVEDDSTDSFASTASFAQDDVATFVASPRNGYRFDGWFVSKDSNGTPVSTNARFDVKMDVAKTYYAAFAPDRNAIYRFGDSKETKTMVWHSKRIEVNSPTSFSVAQVDAEGYDNGEVVLSILKASSPNVPMKKKDYAIKNCNTRKLAIDGRGEKAFEFEVTSTVAVNKVQVSTSVAGLLGGA